MSGPEAPADVEAFLQAIADEVAKIQRGRDYSLWRSEAKHRVNDFLSQAEPFSQFATCWVFSGDGAGLVVGGRFGEWAIDRLVEKKTPAEIVARFRDEVARNKAVYEDVSPMVGLEITEAVELAPGVRLVPPAADIFDALGYTYRFAWPNMPTGTGFLVQTYTVAPAFERWANEASNPTETSVTLPPLAARDETRRRCRLACLLGSTGGVELPMSVILSDRSALLAVGGTVSGRPFAPHPLVSFPADMVAITRAFGQLASFAEGDSLTRAIDRLGRSRIAVHPVDRALDLGMAAEIVLMHDQGRSNTEITHKIASRAAWLLGEDAGTRAEIFNQIKLLYAARSTAVHSGMLPSKSSVDLDAADDLVAQVIRAILERGSFPDWMSLTLGGS